MGECANCGKRFGILTDFVEVGRIQLCFPCARSFNSKLNMMKARKTEPEIDEQYLELVPLVEQNRILNNATKDRVLEEIEKLKCELLVNIKKGEKVDPVETEEIGQPQEPGFIDSWDRESRFSIASGKNLPYVVLQVTLKEKLLGTGSGNLEDLEEVINTQVEKGYRLHTMSTSNGGSKGMMGGDRIQATLVFERLDIYQGNYSPSGR